jgi:hypothetical protein
MAWFWWSDVSVPGTPEYNNGYKFGYRTIIIRRTRGLFGSRDYLFEDEDTGKDASLRFTNDSIINVTAQRIKDQRTRELVYEVIMVVDGINSHPILCADTLLIEDFCRGLKDGLQKRISEQ